MTCATSSKVADFCWTLAIAMIRCRHPMLKTEAISARRRKRGEWKLARSCGIGERTRYGIIQRLTSGRSCSSRTLGSRNKRTPQKHGQLDRTDITATGHRYRLRADRRHSRHNCVVRSSFSITCEITDGFSTWNWLLACRIAADSREAYPTNNARVA